MTINRQFTVAAEDIGCKGGVLGYPICFTPMVEQVTVHLTPNNPHVRDRTVVLSGTASGLNL